MRLNLKAESKTGVGYTPDWLKVSYRESKEDFELTLDIWGETDYDRNGLNCRTKGDLLPWTLVNLTTGEETDLSVLSKEEMEKKFPVEKLADILHRASAEEQIFTVGIFPVNCTNTRVASVYAEDVVSNGEGTCVLYDGNKVYEIKFRFDTELNLYFKE